MTVADLAPDWLASQEPNVKPSTYVWLEGAVRVYVLPKWGSVKIADIRHSAVQAWITDLASGSAPTTKKTTKALSAASVRRAYGALAAILDAAVKDRRLAVNPARDVKLPRKQSKRRHYLDHAQVERLARQAGTHGTLVRFLAYTGLRWGEAIALRVEDLDMLRRRVDVHRNAVRVNGRMVVGTPKSHEARSVPFPAFLTHDLARLCEGKPRDALVFGNGSTFLGQPTHRDAWFTKALAAIPRDRSGVPAADGA